jgi:glutaminyl-peptide cyclotransferase
MKARGNWFGKVCSRALVILAAIATCCATAHPASAQTHGVSGQAVYKLTQEYLAAAPKRYIGSPGHAAAENFIKAHFAPETAKGNFVTDSFSARTPIGQLSMTNYIVKFPGKKDGIIVLASHYETNYPLKDINFVGANDGACTTALLIALGQYYRTHPPQGYSIWLLFDDGEEAVKEWSSSDSLYGTRHLAARWSGDGTIGHIKAFIVADMIGWKSMNITRESNSTPWLLDLLAKAGKDTGHVSYLFRDSQAIEDDHLPFRQRNVPVLDIIDYEYGTANDPEAFHHTEKDTLDKLSPASLQVSADLFLDVVKLIDQR